MPVEDIAVVGQREVGGFADRKVETAFGTGGRHGFLAEAKRASQGAEEPVGGVWHHFGALRHKHQQIPAASRPVLDAIATRAGVLHAVLEIKCRTNPLHQYPTYMIDLHKLTTLHQLSTMLGCAAILVVRFVDFVTWVSVPDALAAGTVGEGGRTDRDDPSDIDTVMLIPTKQMRRL